MFAQKTKNRNGEFTAKAQVFLDKLKNASETQERMRREGFEFFLNADGTITQKNKTQENKF